MVLEGDIYIRQSGREHLSSYFTTDVSSCVSKLPTIGRNCLSLAFHSAFQQHLQQGDQLPERGRWIV